MSFYRCKRRSEVLAVLEREKHNQSRKKFAGVGWPIVAVVSIGLSACNRQQPAAHLSPPAVTVSKPVQKEIVNWTEFTGRMAAVKFVRITGRVSGYIVD